MVGSLSGWGEFRWLQRKSSWLKLAPPCCITCVSFEKQEGPWLPGTLTSRDLSCVSEPGLNRECEAGRALLARGWGNSMGKGTKEE